MHTESGNWCLKNRGRRGSWPHAHTHTHTHAHTHTHTQTHVHTHTYIHQYIHVRMCVCMYTYTCIHTGVQGEGCIRMIYVHVFGCLNLGYPEPEIPASCRSQVETLPVVLPQTAHEASWERGFDHVYTLLSQAPINQTNNCLFCAVYQISTFHVFCQSLFNNCRTCQF